MAAAGALSAALKSPRPSVDRSDDWLRLAAARCLEDTVASAACFACLACLACTSTECGDFFRVGGRLESFFVFVFDELR